MLDHGPPISRVENMDTDVAIDWGEHNWSGRESAHLLFAGSQSASGKKRRLKKPIDLVRFAILHQFDRSEWQA